MSIKAHVFWCTGMSGAGKSSVAEYVKRALVDKGFRVLVLDGDVVRERYETILGFGRGEVRFNNLNVARMCQDERYNYDVIIVPIISPYADVRMDVRKTLQPSYQLVYFDVDMKTLISRDTKGLYEKARRGEITNLLGYSDGFPYEVPADAEYVVNTAVESLEESGSKLATYINNVVAIDQMVY